MSSFANAGSARWRARGRVDTIRASYRICSLKETDFFAGAAVAFGAGLGCAVERQEVRERLHPRAQTQKLIFLMKVRFMKVNSQSSEDTLKYGRNRPYFAWRLHSQPAINAEGL